MGLNMAFSDTEMKELGRRTQINIHNTRSSIRALKFASDIFYKSLKVSFKNCATFIKCTTKNDETTIDDAEDLDLVVPMYNWIDYSSIYSETTARLKFYFKDEATSFNADIANTNDFKSFKYKAINYSKTLKLIWQTEF